MATLIFTKNGKLTTKFIKSFGRHAANLLTTINEKDCIREEILKTHADQIDEKVITAASPIHYNLDLEIGSHHIHLSYRDYKTAHQDYNYFRVMIADAIAYRNACAKSVGCIILARYSTSDNSWQSAYINHAIAFKHIRDEALSHFCGQWDEETETTNVADIRRMLDQREGIIEFGEWSVELEYGETIYTE
jgi:hypothetical protein